MMLNVLKIYLVSILLVFLHFGAQIRYWTDWWNRNVYRWDGIAAAALVLDLILIALLIALLAVAAQALTQRWKLTRLQRVFDHLFVVVLLSGLMSLCWQFFVPHPGLRELIWMAAMLVIGFSLAWPRSRLATYAFNLCLIFSPAPLILSAQIFSWESWANDVRTEFAVREAEGIETPVYVFIFDEWSLDRSVWQGEFRTVLPNLRRLGEQSVVFRDALSPYKSTELSLPRIIYQTDASLAWKGAHQVWSLDGKEVPSTEVPSLFQLAKDHRYNGYLLGWHLAYRRLLGDQPDYCLSYDYRPKGRNLPEEMLLMAHRSVQFWTDPLSRKLWRTLNPRVSGRHFYETNRRFRDEMFRIIEDGPTNTFALFHLLPPHDPHVFNPDGTYCAANMSDTAEDYERSIRYADFLLGETVDRLRAAGKFDDALIVVTSDHAYKKEPEPAYRANPDWQRRVPLIVKLPGQQEPLVVDEEICTTQLRPLFEAVCSGEYDTERLIDLVRRLPGSTVEGPLSGTTKPLHERVASFQETSH